MDDEFIELFGNDDGSGKGTYYGYDGEFNVGLVVLGNGFDLQCGLKTRYADFFEFCENAVDGSTTDSVYSIIEKILKEQRQQINPDYRVLYELFKNNPNYSVWDLYFIYISEEMPCKTWNWMDVEEEIKYSLFNDYIWKSACVQFDVYISNKSTTNILDAAYEYDDLSKVIAAIMYNRYVLNKNSPVKVTHTKDIQKTFYEALLEELKILENRFGEYIKDQYETNKEQYLNAAQQNITAIYKKGIEEVNKNGYLVKPFILRIISFNYIPLLDDALNKNFILYIHGDYNAPIFGIPFTQNPNGDSFIDCCNLFSKKQREGDNAVSSVNEIVPKSHNLIGYNPTNVYVFTYGLSFGSVDTEDFKKILMDDNTDCIRETLLMYPIKNDKKEENRITSEAHKNLSNVLKSLAVGYLDKDIQDLFSNGTIKQAPLLMKCIEEKRSS